GLPFPRLESSIRGQIRQPGFRCWTQPVEARFAGGVGQLEKAFRHPASTQRAGGADGQSQDEGDLQGRHFRVVPKQAEDTSLAGIQSTPMRSEIGSSPLLS
ncbi:MAG: hypothetical protein ACK56F_23645, partial [bacterium]